MNAQANTPAAVATAPAKVAADDAAITAARVPGATAAAVRKSIWSVRGPVMVAFGGVALEVSKASVVAHLTALVDAKADAVSPFVFTPVAGKSDGKGGHLTNYTPAPVADAKPEAPAKAAKGDKAAK